MRTKRMTISDARKIYTDAGGQFFTKKSMNFWGTRIVSGLYSNRCFITTEFDYSGEHRYFNIRQFSEDYTKIRTVSPFNQITTKQMAVDLVHNPHGWVDSSF